MTRHSKPQTIYENIKRIETIKANIRKEYAELNKLNDKVVKEMLENDTKEMDCDDDTKATLVWAVDKKIDYTKLMNLYPDIYKLGIKPTFSTTQALKSVSPSLLNKIIKDCTKKSAQYNLKVGRKK